MIIPCQVIEQGPDSIIEYGADNFIDEVYYAEYNCELWDCVGNSSFPLVLFSEKAMDYWRAKFLLLAAISIALFALIFFISRNRTTTFIVTGILIILSSLPFRGLGWVLNLLPSEFSGIFSAFFAKSHAVFIIMLVIGIIFIGIGIIFKLFGWSMNFMKKVSEDSDKKEFSKSDVKEIVKEEMSKKDLNKPKQKKRK
jgi:c-di-AMP phosphodiesterase-like protein